MADSAMQTILVAADDGTFYRFDRSAAKVSAGQEGILVGCPVTVTYRGTLDPELTAQQVEVLSISVGSPADSPAEPAETEEPASLEEQACTLLAGMSLEEKVGQMFLAAAPKRTPPGWPQTTTWGDTSCSAGTFQEKRRRRSHRPSQPTSRQPLFPCSSAWMRKGAA